jgi:hypothetical protein
MAARKPDVALLHRLPHYFNIIGTGNESWRINSLGLIAQVERRRSNLLFASGFNPLGPAAIRPYAEGQHWLPILGQF